MEKKRETLSGGCLIMPGPTLALQSTTDSHPTPECCLWRQLGAGITARLVS